MPYPGSSVYPSATTFPDTTSGTTGPPALFAESFEQGTAGAAVTAANTAFSAVGADITFTASAVPSGGSLAAQVAPATSAARVLQVDYPAAQSTLYRRWYMYMPANPPAVFTVAQVKGGGAVRASLRIQGSGALVVFNGNTNILSAPSGTVPAGTWMRVEWRIDQPASTQQVRLFYGANLHGDTASYDTGARAFTAGSVDQSLLGTVTAQQTTLIFDDVRDSDTTWVGPITSGGPTVTTLNLAASGSGTLTATVTSVTSSLNLSITGSGTLAASVYAIPVPPPSVRRLFHEWSMFARGVNYAPTVALPILSLVAVVRHMGIGKAVASTTLTADRWLALAPGNGVTLFRDGRQEFTGLVVTRRQSWDAESGRAVIQFECEGDETRLADTLVFPDPLRAADDQTVNNYWRYTGRASTAMQRLISDQVGPTARADRQVTGLTLGDDPGTGVSRAWSALFNSDGNALGTLQKMSVASGANLGLRMTASAGVLRVDITAPRNIPTAVFSADLSNLVAYDYSESAPTVTHALSAGQGDLKARQRKLAATTDPVALQWRRQRWSYIDRRDTADTAELLQEAQDALGEGGPTVSLTVTLTDSDAATYGVDWQLGDRISVYVGLPGQPKPAVVADVVREIQFEVDEMGAEKIRPAIGSYDATAVIPTPTQRQLSLLGAKLSSLEARK
jgi:hypothetical protein